MQEWNFEKMSICDAKLILAALDFYANGIESKQKYKKLSLRKDGIIASEVKKLKKMIENSKSIDGVSIKESVAMYEENRYEKLVKQGLGKEELAGAFMYEELFDK